MAQPRRTRLNIIATVTLTSLLAPVLGRAQGVSIPDAGLNAAIRDTLNKPVGLLTEADLLSLTNLDASRRNVSSIDGLEAARNLVSLDLQVNSLTHVAVPDALTNLGRLNLSSNPLTNCFLPGSLTNLTALSVDGGELTHLALPAELPRLNSLALGNNDLISLTLPTNLTSLGLLDLSFNSLTHFSLPGGLTNLTTFLFAANQLTHFTLPAGLTGMTNLSLAENQLSSLVLPEDMTNLLELDLAFNQLTNLTLPGDLRSLTGLELDFNHFSTLDLSSNLAGLLELHLRHNQFSNFVVPAHLTGMVYLDVSENPLRDITLPGSLAHLSLLRLAKTELTQLQLPSGLTNLTGLFLTENHLTNVVLPPDLNHLQTLNLAANQLSSLALPLGLSNLVGLFVVSNQLTRLTLPPDMTRLTGLGYLENPLDTVVLPETLAATNLAGDIASLQSAGVSVFTYPLTLQLVRPRMLTGAFKFGITGPPGVYSVWGSSDLTAWNELGAATNSLGSISYIDVNAHLSPQNYYRVLPQNPPADMVFIPPTTFTMGSPTNDLNSNSSERPQTTVILTRGFWIGKHEVTQGEYLSVTGANPSDFPGDLSRPVSSVSWYDATNYCAKLTERELAAGRIPAGSCYRLPTEAEWECAARAGTTTQYSYGDDQNGTSATNYMWELLFSPDLTVHPVGQKLPNPWGLYDVHGNVWEWCQDWYDTLPGGVQVDTTGPPGPVLFSSKVMRGGAYDYAYSSCRSAARLFRPAIEPDTDLGFRVVLVRELH